MMTKSSFLSNEKYEEYSKSKPYDFISLYFHYNLTGEQPIIDDAIFMNEIVRALNVANKYEDIWIDELRFASALNIVNVMKTDIMNLLPMCQERISPFKDMFIKNNAGLFTFKKWKEDLDELKRLLPDKKTSIIIGKPGTGKTHIAIDKIANLGDATLVVSLSNLVGANFVSRFKKSEKTGECAFASYTKVRFMEMPYFDTIVFEEASMLSMNELPLILKCVEHCDNVIFCGDTNQLPSFLGFGNILYGLINEFPENVIALKKNHRCAFEVVNGMDAILNGQFPKMNTKSEFANALDDALFNDHNMVVTALTNENVRNMNRFCLQRLSGNDSRDDIETVLTLKKKRIPIRATSNIKVKTTNGNFIYKFYNNELCDLIKEGRQYIVKSRLYPEHHQIYDSLDFLTIDENQQPRDFMLAYAITVHKAQGLEWDDVFFINDANEFLKNRNLCYVAYTRSKKNTYIFSPDNNASTGKKIVYRNIFR